MDAVVSGLLLGGMYAATAVGLTLVFGALRLVNLAHGEFLMIGAYLTSVLVAVLGADPLLLAIPAAAGLGALAYPLQRYVLGPVMARNPDAPVIATFGVGLALQAVMLLAFGGKPMSLTTSYTTAQLDLGGVHVRVSLLITLAIAAAMVLALWLLLNRTRFGRRVRAAASDPVAAGVIGVNVPHVFALVLAIATAAAAIAGTLIAVTYSVSPVSGMPWLVIAFTVVVIGGLGSVSGALVAGLIVGLVQTVGEVFIGAQYRDIIVFVLLVIILLVRPEGLFTRRRRA